MDNQRDTRAGAAQGFAAHTLVEGVTAGECQQVTSAEPDWRAIGEMGLKLMGAVVEHRDDELRVSLALLKELAGGLDRESLVKMHTRHVPFDYAGFMDYAEEARTQLRSMMAMTEDYPRRAPAGQERQFLLTARNDLVVVLRYLHQAVDNAIQAADAAGVTIDEDRDIDF